MELPITFHGKKISPFEKAKKEIDFIINRIDHDVYQIVEAFWKDMSPQGNHLADHIQIESKYNEIAVFASDLKLIKPLFYLYPEHQYLDIADIGAGRKRLGRAILDYFKNVEKKSSYLNWISNLQNPQYGSKDVTVIGTDLYDWHETDGEYEGCLIYRLQPTPSQVPIEENSQDVVVTKWCLHHMTRGQMDQ